MIELIATDDRDPHDGIDRDTSIALLRQRAAGRADLLAEVAGHYLHLFLGQGETATDAPDYASLLIAAGADLALTAARGRPPESRRRAFGRRERPTEG